MATPHEFNPAQVITELRQRYEERMITAGVPANDLAVLLDFLTRMAEVASQLIAQEKVIQIPNTEQSVPFDGHTAYQTMSLFTEGLYFAIFKSWEMKLPEDLKTQFLQNVAQYVYDNAKQLVLSTYGQEHTPDYQITEDQQINMVNQTAESALLFFVNEYEKANGPIQSEFPSTEDWPEELSQDEVPNEPIMTQEVPSIPTKISPVKGPHPHDKYAALALLLNTVTPYQKAFFYRQFTSEEQQVLDFYSNPENIQARLDMNHVVERLTFLKTQLRQRHSIKKQSPANRAIEELTHQYPRELLFSYVRRERPAIQHYLEAFFNPEIEKTGPTELIFEPDNRKETSLQQLPPKIEAVLHRYLIKQVS